MTGVETSIAMALGLGLIEICKALIGVIGKKLTPKNSEHAGLARIEAKMDIFAESMAKVTASLERHGECLERIESRLQRVDDTTVETKLSVVNGSSKRS